MDFSARVRETDVLIRGAPLAPDAKNGHRLNCAKRVRWERRGRLCEFRIASIERSISDEAGLVAIGRCIIGLLRVPRSGKMDCVHPNTSKQHEAE
jgi:hypothetical protein